MHNKNFSWTAIDGSKNMSTYFLRHTEKSLMNVKMIKSNIDDLDWTTIAQSNICMSCFTLSSLPSTDDCLINMMNNVEENGYLLISDIHPARTLGSPYYDFNISKTDTIALKPSPIYPDKLIEQVISRDFNLIHQETINDNTNREYAFISIFKKNKS